MTLRRAVLLVPDAREVLGNKKFVKAHTLSHLLMNTCPECGRKLEKRQGKPTIWVCPSPSRPVQTRCITVTGWTGLEGDGRVEQIHARQVKGDVGEGRCVVMNKRERIKLEDLAKEFIIGYVPYTAKQKRILRNIDGLEAEYSALEKRKTRIKHVLIVLYSKLHKPDTS